MKVLLRKIARQTARIPAIGSLVRQSSPERRLEPLDEFVDSDGRRFRRLKGFRDSVVPRWPGMFKEPNPKVDPATIENARNTIAKLEEFLQVFGLTLLDRKVLEIGCHGGAHAFSMAELGARHVFAIDIAEYGARQRDDVLETEQTLEQQQRFLEDVRKNTISRFKQSHTMAKVTFAFLDATNLDAVDAYDAVVSWETLEHITDMQTAIRNIFRALRPGGFSFHEYNPFFSFDGGHSLCTLDFPYGHVVLDEADFRRYVQTYRPNEADVAVRFFQKSLNRMTMTDLKQYCDQVGFETFAFIPWTQRKLSRWIDSSVLEAARVHYPTLSASDLFATSVWILLRKPGSG